jgi:hypothetical protein
VRDPGFDLGGGGGGQRLSQDGEINQDDVKILFSLLNSLNVYHLNLRSPQIRLVTWTWVQVVYLGGDLRTHE